MFWLIIKTAIPASIGAILQWIQETINLVFIGHLNDPTKLAAVGMGNTIINMFAIGPISGLNCAVETLVSQAYGAKRIDLCLVYL